MQGHEMPSLPDRSELRDTEPGYVHSVAPDPQRQDSLDNPRAVEQGCIAVTNDKKYYEFLETKHPVFIKRSLTPSEYLINQAGRLVFPYKSFERMQNEAAAIRFVQDNTTIPTPILRCAFEDHGRYYLITDIVPGVSLGEIPKDKQAVVIEELKGYIAQMHATKSKVMGSFLNNVLPYRFQSVIPREEVVKFREADTEEFVLCHGDLSQSNIIVDETTLKINAILDWEYAGFFPPEFDRAFYLRPGPSVAINGEADDVPELMEVIERWRENISA